MLLLGDILTITLRRGTLVIEIDEKLGRDVQVAVSQGGEKVEVVDAGSGWTLRLGPGSYDLAVQGGEDRFVLDPCSVEVRRGEQVKVRVTTKAEGGKGKVEGGQQLSPRPLAGEGQGVRAIVSAPPPAIAPFDEKEAKEHQEAWAKHLGVPVEMTNAIGMKLVLIPPGEFVMGEGGDAHKVCITKPFYLGKYEVTQEEWERVMGNNPSEFKGPKNPVEQVSWEDCQDFPEEARREVRFSGGELPAADGGAVGVCVPGGNHGQIVFWRQRGGVGRVRLV